MSLKKVVEILTVAKQQVLKYHIQRRCNLAGSDLTELVSWLLKNGLLDTYPTANLKHLPGPKNKHRLFYQTSPKGRLFLKRYNDLLMLLENPAPFKHNTLKRSRY